MINLNNKFNFERDYFVDNAFIAGNANGVLAV